MPSVKQNSSYSTNDVFWENQLKVLETRYLFEGDNSGKIKKSTSLLEIAFEIPQQHWQLINRYSNGGELQTYAILLTCLQITLAKYKPEKQTVICASRPLASGHVQPACDFFPYLLSDLTPDTPLQAAIIKTAEKITQTHERLHRLDLKSLFTPHELTNMVFISSEVHATPLQAELGAFDWALLLQSSINDDTGKLKLLFREQFFSRPFVKRWITHFNNILSSLSQLNKTIKEAPVLEEAEVSRYLHEFGQGKTSASTTDKTVIEVFEAIAGVHAQEPAILYGDRVITYRQLNEEADCLASYLIQEKGLKAGDPVMVFQKKSHYFIICLLAIMKARCVYIPLDAKTPPQRVSEIAKDAGTSLMITTSKLLQELSETSVPTLAIDQELAAIKKLKWRDSLPKPTPQDLAYIIFTSGSTGMPKGVMVEHEGLLNVALFHVALFKMQPEDRYLQFMSLSFDGSILDIFTALLSGAALVIFDNRHLQDKQLFLNGIEQYAVSITTITPSFLSILEEHPLPGIHTLITAGEAADPKLMSFYAKSKHVYNGYGPTEATVNTTIHKVSPEKTYSEGIPVGKPSPDKEVFILNDNLELVPVGIVGELCISGKGLARGYLNAPQLTAEKFIENPFKPGNRLYRTGDLAKWDEAGDIYFMGRKDDQIKLNGHRINLSEIETRIAAYDKVQQAVVLANTARHKGLIAFIQIKVERSSRLEKEDLAEPTRAFKDELNAYIESTLPHYMIPGVLLFLHAFPRTGNQKVDQKALLRLFENRKKAPATESNAISSASSEALLRQVKRVFGDETLTLEDNFFALGGDSLRAITLAAYLAEERYECPVDVILDTPDLLPLSEKLEGIATEEATIHLVEKAPHYPASHAQRRIWTLHQMNEQAGHAYNVPFACSIKGKLDPDQLLMAYQKLLVRHEILRTSFALVENRVVQKIHKQDETLTNFKVTAAESSIDQQLQEDFTQVFDLESGPLIRLRLYKSGPQQQVLSMVAHHIIFDGWSLKVFLNELFSLYQQEANLTSLPFQYKDYTYWHNNALDNELKVQKAFWHKQYETITPAPELDMDFKRGVVQSFNGKTLQLELNSTQSQTIDRLVADYDISPYVVFMAISSLLLARYSGQSKVVSGSPFSNREIKGLETQIGFYVNVLPVQVEVLPNQTVADFIWAVKKQIMAVSKNQQYPFDLLIEDLNLERKTNQTPLYNVVVTWLDQQKDFSGIGENEWHITPIVLPTDISKYDLTFSFGRTEDNYTLHLNYNTDLYAESRVLKMWNHLQSIIRQFGQDQHQKIGQLSLLTNAEIEQLHTFNTSPFSTPPYESVICTFNRLVKENPDKIALDNGHERYTRARLQKDADLLANTLTHSKLLSDGKAIGVAMTPSYASVVSFIGILKAGMVYVPIEPGDPSDRISYIIEDAGLAAIITQGTATESLTETAVPLLNFEEISATADGFRESKAEANQTAYVIYTSGTTGRPKGIEISHAALHNFCHFHNAAFELNEHHASLLYSSLSFDASVWEFWPYLMAGACLHPIPASHKLDIREIIRFVTVHQITHAFLPPAILRQVISQNEEEYLKKMILHTGGEPLVNTETMTDYKVVNNYGLTETTVIATSTMGEQLHTGSNIGKPFSGFNIYIVDSHMQLCPIGVTGELTFSGTSLTSGYLNDPMLNRHKLVDNPFGDDKLLMSGDFGYWTEKGNIIFKGRKDNQVQLNGRRVELGEVEAIVESHNEVTQAVVLNTGEASASLLTAFYMADRPLEASALRQYTSSRLPKSMVPHRFVQMERFPLTSQGKTDHRKLRNLLEDIPEEVQKNGSSQLTSTEIFLCGEIGKVLGKTIRSTDDSFFDLGADSVAVISFHSRIAEKYPKVKVTDFFTYHNIHQLASFLDGTASSITDITITPEMAFKLPEQAAYDVQTGTEIIELKDMRLIESTADRFAVTVNDVVVSLFLYSLQLVTHQNKVPVFVADPAAGKVRFISYDFEQVDSEQELFNKTHQALHDSKASDHPLEDLEGLNLIKKESGLRTVCIALVSDTNQTQMLYRHFDLVLQANEYQHGTFRGSITQSAMTRGFDIKAILSGLEQVFEGLRQSIAAEK